MEIKVRGFTSLIVLLIMIFLLYSHYVTKSGDFALNKNTYVLIVTSSICAVNLIYSGYSANSNNINKDNIYLLLLGIFSIASIAYTIYEWDTINPDKENKCSIIIPTSNKFSGDNEHSSNYYIYRTLYLTTLIVLVVVLQFKIDDSTFTPLNMDKKVLHMVLFLLPFIMPMLTESFTWLSNLILQDGNNPDLKPETLLLNFIKGDSTRDLITPEGSSDSDYGSWWRSVMPILLYLTLMGLAILSGMGKIGTDGGKTAIFIIAGFLIFFSFIMRTLFVQNCVVEDRNKVVGAPSTDPDGGTSSFPCSFEKYGGIQTMLNICLIIIIIYHVDKPSYKLLFFTIILLASWALSSTYILNLDKQSDD